MSKQQVSLPGISARAWEHPADRAALSALKRLPGMDQALRAIFGFTSDKAIRLYFLATSVRVTERQYPKVWNILDRACNILDLPRPELYLSNHPVANAGAVGVDKPFILLHSALVEQLDEDELLFVIGHELGHIASGHALYRTMVELIIHYGQLLTGIGMPPLVMTGIMFALLEWYRKSELSADRAGLLTCQDPQTAYSAFMKMAGGRNSGDMSLDEFLIQAAEYDKGSDVLDDLFKALNLMGQTHPFPVLRLSQLKPWADGGEYQTTLSGKYPRREDDPAGWNGGAEPLFKDMNDAGQAYRTDWDRSEGPFKEGFDNLGKGMDQLGKDAGRLFKDLFSGFGDNNGPRAP